MIRAFVVIAALGFVSAQVDFEALKKSVTGSSSFQQKVMDSCKNNDLVHDDNDGKQHEHVTDCHQVATDKLFCELLQRSKPDLAAAHCGTAPSFAQVKTRTQRLRETNIQDFHLSHRIEGAP